MLKVVVYTRACGLRLLGFRLRRSFGLFRALLSGLVQNPQNCRNPQTPEDNAKAEFCTERRKSISDRDLSDTPGIDPPGMSDGFAFREYRSLHN